MGIGDIKTAHAQEGHELVSMAVYHNIIVFNAHYCYRYIDMHYISGY